MQKKRQQQNKVWLSVLTLTTLAAVIAVGITAGIFDEADYAISYKEGKNRANVEEPVFSVDSGFYEEAFDLTITVPQGYKVYYTVDGSVPSEKSLLYDNSVHVYNRSSEPNRYRSIPNTIKDYDEKWTEPETVDKCFVIRAIAVDENGNGSDVVTKSYFVGLGEYKNEMVVSLVADPEDLFGDNGIYVTGSSYDTWYKLHGPLWAEPPANFERSGKDWEREANIEIIQGEEIVLNRKVGIRVQGAGSRSTSNKRLSIYARERYGGKSTFEKLKFKGTAQLHAIQTRGGLLNYISQELGRDRDVLTTPGVHAVIFLNGEQWYGRESFWGIFEKVNSDNIAARYGLPESYIAIAKSGTETRETEEGENPLSRIVDYIDSNDLSNAKNYETFGQIIDVQSYIDMMCIRVYMADCDFSEEKNVLLWHTTTKIDDSYGDTKWRWGLYDMDLLWYYLAEEFGETDSWEIDNFTMYGSFVTQEPVTQWPIYSALRVNDDFCKQFVLTYMDLINANFKAENVEPILENSGGSAEEIEEVLTFFENRPPYAMKYLAQEFDLTGEAQTVTLIVNDIEGGTVQLNTITPEFKDDSWSGLYFTDYPITLTAVPQEGYRFDHWEVDGEYLTAETIEAAVRQGGTSICAIFEPVA